MTLEEKSMKRFEEIIAADGEASAEHHEEKWDADTIIKQLEEENPDRKVTSIKIYRDEHSAEMSVLVGFKGKSNYESGVIYMKRPSRLQLLISWIKSLFRKKRSVEDIELYGVSINRAYEQN